MLFGAGAIPPGDHGQESHVAARSLDLLKVIVVEHPVTAQRFRGLAHYQPQVGQLERDILKTEERSRLRLVACHDLGVQLEPWQRNPALNAPLHFE
jgi:hypothetical protein